MPVSSFVTEVRYEHVATWKDLKPDTQAASQPAARRVDGRRSALLQLPQGTQAGGAGSSAPDRRQTELRGLLPSGSAATGGECSDRAVTTCREDSAVPSPAHGARMRRRGL